MIRIPTKTHGIMDFVMSATFMAAPLLLKNLSKNGSNGSSNGSSNQNGRYNGSLQNVALPAMGAGILAQGLMTNHEFGAVKAMDMKTHLLVDLALGGLMIASPWLLNMDRRVKVPLVAMGAATIGLALMTQLEPGYEQFDEFDDEPETLLDEIEEQF